MNAQEMLRMQARIAALEAQVRAINDLLFPAAVEPDPPKVEGADVVEDAPVEDAAEAVPAHKRPRFEGLEDLGRGWFDVYWAGRKVNVKALRQQEANALLDNHRQMQNHGAAA